MHHLKVLDFRGEKIPATRHMAATHYEGAGTGRRMSYWGLSSAGPNNSLYSSLNSLRSRSRELVRNDPQIDGGMDTLVANIVGTGITPRWQLEDTGLKKEVQELWNDWVKECDANGICDFYGLQSLAARAMIESGEFFSRFRPRRPEDGLSVPLQLQLLEGDHVDEAQNAMAPNGNEIRMGIEFNRIGQRVAYWMYREHPGESFLAVKNPFEKIRIPATEVLHAFKPLRIGQQRAALCPNVSGQ